MPSRAPPPRWPNVGPPLPRSSWRLAGGWSQAFRALVTWIASESRAARGLSTDLPRDTSLRIAQRISCTLHRENARAILRRSPGSVSGSSGLVRLGGDLLVWVAGLLCLCRSFLSSFLLSLFLSFSCRRCPLSFLCVVSLGRSVARLYSFLTFFRLFCDVYVRPSLLASRYFVFFALSDPRRSAIFRAFRVFLGIPSGNAGVLPCRARLLPGFLDAISVVFPCFASFLRVRFFRALPDSCARHRAAEFCFGDATWSLVRSRCVAFGFRDSILPCFRARTMH